MIACTTLWAPSQRGLNLAERGAERQRLIPASRNRNAGRAFFTINSIFEEVVRPERLVWRTLRDASRNPSPPTNHNTITLEETGAQTRWMLVARFDSFADRDLTASMGFGQMVSMGLERMAEHLRTM
jgi:uncharacterized protein YndB with AHSA1/START domain